MESDCAGGRSSALALATAAQAKTLVFCSEASPEGFNPQLYTAGTTFDASSKPIYNRLIEFERGGTKTVPGLAESFTVSDDGLTYTFKLRQGVKWQGNKNFTPTRDFNADDVVFSFERQRDPNHPFHKVSGGTYEYFESMDMGNLLKSVEKVDDHTVKFTLAAPAGALHRQHGDGLRLDHVGRVCRSDDEGGHAREDRPRAGRAPARSSWSTISGTP